MKNPEDPKEWIIDEEAAQVVKKIFTLCMNGRGPSQIADQLEKDKVLTPTAYKNKQGVKTPNTKHRAGESLPLERKHRGQYS